MTKLLRAWQTRARTSKPGQALVEMALILMLLLTIVLGTFEFGFAMDHHITLQYATREGARVGSALADGGGTSPACDDVDNQVIAAVQRVLKGEGTQILLSDISQIRLYKANTTGGEIGPVNVWTYAAGAGPLVAGERLSFRPVSVAWSACGRSNAGLAADSIGVSLTYTYRLRTPLSTLFGWATIGMTDRTVMNLNPTDGN